MKSIEIKPLRNLHQLKINQHRNKIDKDMGEGTLKTAHQLWHSIINSFQACACSTTSIIHVSVFVLKERKYMFAYS